MSPKPVFPTQLHQDIAELARDYFRAIPNVDTVLIVNSCARGHATPDSDLDVAVLVRPEATSAEIAGIEAAWRAHIHRQPKYLAYRKSSPFAHLHLDVIDGKYTPQSIENGEPIDYFELEIGNQILYSAPFGTAGEYFRELRTKWLPYYDQELRAQRLAMCKCACEYDLNHISFFTKRGLHFQAFDILYKAFQEYLQALFIACKTYPLAYNKWIRYQLVELLHKPDIYQLLPPILSIGNIESNEVNEKAEMLRELLNALTDEQGNTTSH